MLRNTLAPSDEFWSEFKQHYWERAPCVFGAAPLATTDDVFQAIVRASNRVRHGEHGPRVRFFLGEMQITGPLDGYLPTEKDESVAGYADRLTRQLDGRPFELIVHHIHEHDFELWMRIRNFFRPLHARIGIPADTVEAAVFLRNHERTSFGVHKDPSGTFMFALEGRKRMVTWPYRVFAQQGDSFTTLDYRNFMNHAQILEGRPGQVVYWPSTYWHVGESEPGPSLSLNIGMVMPHQPFRDVLGTLTRLASSRNGGRPEPASVPFDLQRVQQMAQHLPESIEQALRALRGAVQDVPLERAVHRDWLDRVTGGGFVNVPPPKPPRPLSPDAIVRGWREYPIVCLQWSREELIVSAHGHSFIALASSRVSWLVDRLNSGEPCRVHDLLEPAASPADAQALRGALEALVSFGAVILTSH